MAMGPRRESVPPQIPAARAIELIQQQIARLDSEIIKLDRRDGKVEGWKSTTEGILQAAFGKPDGLADRRTSAFLYAHSGMTHGFGMGDNEWQQDYVLVQKKRKALLESYIEQLQMLSSSGCEHSAPHGEALRTHSAGGAKASSCRCGDYRNPIGCEPNCAPS
jgi:hypothetical protein